MSDYGFTNDHKILDILPPHLRQHLSQFTRVQIKDTGSDPRLKEQVAAHEAGHFIFATSAGAVVNRLELYKRKDSWYGRGACRHKPRKKGSGLAYLPLITTVCHNLSGKAGEETAGHQYPSSSLEEYARANVIALALDAVLRVHPGESFSLCARIVSKLLHLHTDVHKELTADLEQNLKLSQAELLTYSARVPRLDLVRLIGRHRHDADLILALLQRLAS